MIVIKARHELHEKKQQKHIDPSTVVPSYGAGKKIKNKKIKDQDREIGEKKTKK